MKQCIDCAKEGAGPKPLSEFNKSARHKDGLNSRCRHHSSVRLRHHYKKSGAKYNAQKKIWRRENPQAARLVEVRKDIKAKYGLTEAEYTGLFLRQGCCCAICKAPLRSQFDIRREFTGRRKVSDAAYVDHCHKSDRVRGLLCFNCNILLGKAKDSAKILLSAVGYLRASATRQAQPSGPRESLSEIGPGDRDPESSERRESRREQLSQFD